MPVQPNPQPIFAYPHQIDVPMPESAHMSVMVQIQNWGQATVAEMDAVQQSLIDYLQAWPGRRQDADVTGSKYDSLLYGVTTNNPGAS